MEHKKVLVIGMFDSIHLARWLAQFTDQKINFSLFPSKKFKHVNSELANLMNSKDSAQFNLAHPYVNFKYVGYLDYFFIKLSKLTGINFKSIFLKKILRKIQFDYVHAIEIQGAGYLCNSLPLDLLNQNNLILTNYGSDIFYFSNLTEHKNQIRSVLERAKFYSGECHRDYELALSKGFSGKFLPCLPNAGGFKDEVFQLNLTPSNQRKLIIAKCYGGTFGLGELIIHSLQNFLSDKPDVKVLLHSITDDLEFASSQLLKNFPNQISIRGIRNKLSRDDLLKNLSTSKIYIGASKSDGISTSFLEALCVGAYPIQTNTSCANEWIDLGFRGSLIEPTVSNILDSLEVTYHDKELDQKRIRNLELARMHLSFNKIKDEAKQYYGILK